MTDDTKPQILCVDDEPMVLEGMQLHLRRKFDVVTAGSGLEALRVLEERRGIAAVVSDMRMPGMTGAQLFQRCKEKFPDAVRLLLTGLADLEVALAAINEGQVFRMLMKPCPAPALLVAVDAAVEQHRLITAERVLLEQTLRGCIRALTDALAAASPETFGRATRLRATVRTMTQRLSVPDPWIAEVSAMLYHLGFIAVPHDVAERYLSGVQLTRDESAMIARVPEVALRLLANIPRIDAVRSVLQLMKPDASRTDGAFAACHRDERIAEILRVVLEFDLRAQRGEASAAILRELRNEPRARFAPELLDLCADVHWSADESAGPREVGLRELLPGMVLAGAVRDKNDMLLVAKGTELTLGVIERIRNYGAERVVEPLLVLGASHRSEAAAAKVLA